MLARDDRVRRDALAKKRPRGRAAGHEQRWGSVVRRAPLQREYEGIIVSPSGAGKIFKTCQCINAITPRTIDDCRSIRRGLRPLVPVKYSRIRRGREARDGREQKTSISAACARMRSHHSASKPASAPISRAADTTAGGAIDVHTRHRADRRRRPRKARSPGVSQAGNIASSPTKRIPAEYGQVNFR